MFGRTARNLFAAQDGVTAIEYGLIAALVSVAVVVSIQLTGTGVQAVFEGPVAMMDQANYDGGGGGDGGGGDGVEW